MSAFIRFGWSLLAKVCISDQERALERSIHDALRAMQWIDGDDDGVVNHGEVRTTFSIPATRASPGRALYDKRRLLET